jgi:ribosomal protein S27AE
MELLRTYADKLRDEGRVTTGTFQCPECDGPPQPAFAIVEVAPDRWVCGNCHITEQQKAKLAEEEAAAAQLPPWETQAANDVRQARLILQEKWRWAVMPDSPLSAAAQARIMPFLRALNTLTIDYATPEDVVWPTEPVLTGDDYDTDA